VMLQKICAQEASFPLSIRRSGTLQPVHRLPENFATRGNIHQAFAQGRPHIWMDRTARPPSLNERWSRATEEAALFKPRSCACHPVVQKDLMSWCSASHASQQHELLASSESRPPQFIPHAGDWGRCSGHKRAYSGGGKDFSQ
jgi:hypothetical protein